MVRRAGDHNFALAIPKVPLPEQGRVASIVAMAIEAEAAGGRGRENGSNYHQQPNMLHVNTDNDNDGHDDR